MGSTIRNKFIILATLGFSGVAVIYLFNLDSPWFVKPYVWYNDNLYTRGQIHFESMESGMRHHCWTISKKYLQLVCPILEPNSDLELETAFFLTSCFCQSTRNVPIFCDVKQRAYGSSLAKCAKGKCHNQHGHDAFLVVLSRMYDVCHYYLQRSSVDKTLKPFLTKVELAEMAYEAKGAGSGRPILKHLAKLVDAEVKSRTVDYKGSFRSYLDEVGLVLEDFGYHLGLISYEYNH